MPKEWKPVLTPNRLAHGKVSIKSTQSKIQISMKTKLLLSLSSLVALSLSAADPKEDIASAAKRLAQHDNYGWKSTTETGNFNSTTEGKADKDGLVALNMKFGDN